MADIYNLNLNKTVESVDPGGDNLLNAPGDVITYDIKVLNEGNRPLTNVVVTDPLVTDLAYDSGDTNADGILDVGEIWQYTGTYTITQEDLNGEGNAVLVETGDGFQNSIENTATADSTQTGPASGSSVVTLVYDPQVSIDKIADKDSVSAAGEIITYTITVANEGNVDLTNVVLEDEFAGGATISSGDTDGDSVLDVGETWVYTADYEVTQADLNANVPLVNVATVTTDQTETEEDDATTAVGPGPLLTIDKTADKESVMTAGETIAYTIAVANIGSVELTNVVLDDTFAGGATLASGDDDGDSVLDVGETWIYTADYDVTQEDLDAGDDLVNVAIVDTDQTEAQQDDAVTGIVQTPALTIDKVADVDTVSAAGDVINYTITVDNTGNVGLTGVVVTDDFAGGATLTEGDTDGDSVLDVDETWIYAADYEVTQADIDAGTALINVATVDTDQTEEQSDETSTAIVFPEFEVDKKVCKVIDGKNGKVVDSAGDVIKYKVVVENTGDTAITGVQVNDPLLSNLELVKGDANDDGVLDVGEKWVFKGSYEVTQEDIDSNGTIEVGNINEGKIDNTVTVTTENAGEKSDSASVKLKYCADFEVDKKYWVEDGRADEAGEEINYSIRVENTGNATLTGIVVTDHFADEGAVYFKGDLDQDNALDVGETWVYRAIHALTEKEVQGGGKYINVVTVSTEEAGDDSAYVVTKIYNDNDDCKDCGKDWGHDKCNQWTDGDYLVA